MAAFGLSAGKNSLPGNRKKFYSKEKCVWRRERLGEKSLKNCLGMFLSPAPAVLCLVLPPPDGLSTEFPAGKAPQQRWGHLSIPEENPRKHEFFAGRRSWAEAELGIPAGSGELGQGRERRLQAADGIQRLALPLQGSHRLGKHHRSAGREGKMKRERG